MYQTSIYDTHASTEKSIVLTFPKAEFIEMWLNSPEPFSPALAHDLPLQVHVRFHYVYLYDPYGGAVSDYSFQGAAFDSGRLLPVRFSEVADSLAQKALEPLLRYIEGQRSPFCGSC